MQGGPKHKGHKKHHKKHHKNAKKATESKPKDAKNIGVTMIPKNAPATKSLLNTKATDAAEWEKWSQ
jgi:hypothetical protein